MMDKPKDVTGYTASRTERAERVLLEVWSRLADYHDHLVLVGGLVPRYLVSQHDEHIPRHCGTLDVDLAVSLAVSNVKAYSGIRQTLERIGLRPDTNDRGNERRHSFVMESEGGSIVVDFLTTIYDGPRTVIRAIESQLSAIQAEGMGLAFKSPREITVEGKSLLGGIVAVKLRVCRPVPFIALKALAFNARREGKDANDLVYMLRYADKGPALVAHQITGDEKRSSAFRHAIAVLESEFKSPAHDGPQRYARFLRDESDATVQAFAAVQEFLDELR